MEQAGCGLTGCEYQPDDEGRPTDRLARGARGNDGEQNEQYPGGQMFARMAEEGAQERCMVMLVRYDLIEPNADDREGAGNQQPVRDAP